MATPHKINVFNASIAAGGGGLCLGKEKVLIINPEAQLVKLIS